MINDAKIFGIDLSYFDPLSILLSLQEFTSKPLLTEGDKCLTKKYGISKYDIVKKMHFSEIHADIKCLIKQIIEL